MKIILISDNKHRYCKTLFDGIMVGGILFQILPTPSSIYICDSEKIFKNRNDIINICTFLVNIYSKLELGMLSRGSEYNTSLPNNPNCYFFQIYGVSL